MTARTIFAVIVLAMGWYAFIFWAWVFRVIVLTIWTSMQ